VAYANAEGHGGLQKGCVRGSWFRIRRHLQRERRRALRGCTTAFLASTDNLSVAADPLGDSNTAASSIQSVSPNDFRAGHGNVYYFKRPRADPVGIVRVGAGDNGSAPDALTSIAAPDGSYELVLPLGSPDLTYNAMDIAAFDRLTFTIRP